MSPGVGPIDLVALAGQMLPAQAYVYFCVLTRVAGMLAFVPALGEFQIPQQFRIVLALAIAVAITPLVAAGYPATPGTSTLAFAGLIVHEAIIGLVIGLLLRIALTAVTVAGAMIASQTGLGFAMAFDPAQGAQGALIGTFLSVIAIVLIFASDLHHVFIAGIAGSFTLFPPAAALDGAMLAGSVIEAASASFLLGVQLSAPFIVAGLAFNLGAGVVNKLMPQVQSTFILMPVQILGGLGLFMVSLPLMMTVFLDAFGRTASALFGG